jgi:AraC family transcriptional regulator
MTPHQFVLRTRLHRAAVRLRRSDEAVSVIAFDMGFNDLSTFNRRFRRVMGSSPSAYRAAGSRRGLPGSNRDQATATNGLVHWRQNPHDWITRPGVPRRRG